MGTTLTGATPQDTYDSLIKVTDNGPIDGTAKYLSDGLGNDSVLALSTTALGIGTTSLSGKFHAQATNSGIFFDLTTAYTPIIKAAGALSDLQIESVGSGGNLILGAGGAASIISFFTNGNSTTGERVRITSTGNVGIGTSGPTSKLQVAGTGAFVSSTATINGSNGITISKGDNSYHNGIFFEAASVSDVYFGRTTGVSDDLVFKRATGSVEVARIQMNNGGISFNGDTAAANALDDYEEGTWTMGITFGSGATGVTFDTNTGAYTKIGRQVTATGRMLLTSKGSSTGEVLLTGLPFTVGSPLANISPAAFRLTNITFANQYMGFAQANSTYVLLEEVTEAGVRTALTNADFANDSEIMVSLTYFV